MAYTRPGPSQQSECYRDALDRSGRVRIHPDCNLGMLESIPLVVSLLIRLVPIGGRPFCPVKID
eukprot:scaffold154389_cov25-Prasinocladus_malaysianus.AAC.1